MRVFLTGGTGFIGLRLLKRLRAEDHEVVALARSARSRATLESAGASVVEGDLTESESIAAAVSEAAPTHVAHLAAEIATQRDAGRIHRVNVVGTQALVEACRGLELQAFLFLSTVVRGIGGGQTFTPGAPIPAETVYGKSKERGDELVLQAHAEWGLPGIVLRPSHVYGPGGWFAGLLEDRLFRVPGKGENWWDVAHVDDVVSACELLLAKAPAGNAFHVVDDEPVKMKEFFARAAEALGRKPYGHAPVWLGKLLKGGDTITSAIRSAKSSNSALKELGWSPRYPSSAEGLPASIAALRLANS